MTTLETKKLNKNYRHKRCVKTLTNISYIIKLSVQISFTEVEINILRVCDVRTDRRTLNMLSIPANIEPWYCMS